MGKNGFLGRAILFVSVLFMLVVFPVCNAKAETNYILTEDGKLVICVLDGRQEPFSCGGTMHELAQIMLEAGCVRAFNLDGGGSTVMYIKGQIVNNPHQKGGIPLSNAIILSSISDD